MIRSGCTPTETVIQSELSRPKISVAEQDEFWQAVQQRDHRFFSSFVYGVKSTGIFCRPTCASKKPSRDNVVFFSTAQDALKGGFRACLRCLPDRDQEKPQHVLSIEKACKYIDENYGEKIKLSTLAALANQSPFYFHRRFKQVTGVTPREYLEAVRVKHLKLSLKRGESARRSTYAAGYNTTGWLYSARDPKIGVMPSEYKTGGRGLTIAYNLGDCNLGRLLIGATSSGVCFVALGDSDRKLLACLKDEYPKASVIPEEDAGISMREWISDILSYLEGKNKLLGSELPLDVQATAFQWKVWK